MSVVKKRDNLIPCALGWSDAVPHSWQLMPCRAIVEEKSAKNENSENQNYLSLMANVGIIPYEEKGDVGNKKPEDLSKCKLVSKGDLVINSMNYGIGSYGLSSLDGVCSPVYIVLKPKPSVVHERYALRIFESKSFQKYAQSFGVGILEHRAAIGWDDLKNIEVGIPSLAEQQRLLDYLDRETARIDALITKKTRFIELLREKRQALITHAVTKGLDPNVKMKDSGVEWLGDVPEGWEVKPLKYLATHIGSGKTPSGGAEAYQDSGVIFLRSQNVYEEGLRLDDVAFISPEIDEEMKNSRVFKNDVLLNITGASIGRSCHVSQDIGPANVNQHVCIIRAKFEALGKWVARLMASHVAQSQIDYYQNGAGREGLNFEQIGNMIFAFPPLSEVHDIVEELSKLTSSANLLIKKTERSIEFLKERRSALITAAVTGQIDLREAS